MNTGRLIFTQVTDLIHREQFDRCMALHRMPRASKGMTARDQFLAMAFAQITFRESLRDIEACLGGCAHAYAMGLRGNITRTKLAYANEHRNCAFTKPWAKCSSARRDGFMPKTPTA